MPIFVIFTKASLIFQFFFHFIGFLWQNGTIPVVCAAKTFVFAAHIFYISFQKRAKNLLLYKEQQVFIEAFQMDLVHSVTSQPGISHTS